jgi:hypothetical protein
MAGDDAHPTHGSNFTHPTLYAFKNRRRFLKQVLAGTALAIGGAAGFPDQVDAPSLFTGDAGVFGGLRVETKDLAKFIVAERDQTHAMFNNTYGDQSNPHLAMIAALSAPCKFLAIAAWDWPAWQHPYAHAWHSIYHGLDPAAGVNTDNRFPFSISKYEALKLDVPSVYVTGGGRWGLGFDMFLFRKEPFTVENVQAEIFIALKRQGYPVPSVDVWSMNSAGVTYGCGKWTASSNLYFFWRKDDPSVPFRLQIDVYDFINALKNQGLVKSSNTLTGVFFGGEPIEGWGIWCIDSFYVTLD